MTKVTIVGSICIEKFKRLCFEEKFSMRMVAAALGVSYFNLMYFVKINKIQLRSKSQSSCLCFSEKRRDINGDKNPNYKDGKQMEAGKGKRWARYSLTKEDFEKLIISQSNKCKICFSVFSSTPSIDHCHKTNLVRGLLCNNCNRVLGLLKDDTNILKNAILYLEQARW